MLRARCKFSSSSSSSYYYVLSEDCLVIQPISGNWPLKAFVFLTSVCVSFCVRVWTH